MRIKARNNDPGRRSSAYPREAPVFACLLLVLLTHSCGSTEVKWSARWDSSYGSFSASEQGILARVRAEVDAGRPQIAWSLLSPLTLLNPDNLEAAVLLQEIEGELARRVLEAPVDASPELESALAASDPFAALQALYVVRVREQPTLVSLLLAARLENDTLAARHYLSSALELDPTCAWAHYALAHVALRDGEDKSRWVLAKKDLERALLLDPSHLRARRLQAWMMTQEGSGLTGMQALERWLIETESDPRVADEQRQRAQLDLVREHLTQGNLKLGRRILLALEGGEVDRPRRYLLLACVEHALGNPAAATDAARRAEAASRGAALPIVHQAILLEEAGGSDGESADAWQRVVERATASEDVAGLLQVLRARVLLERRELRASESSATKEK